MEQECAEWYIVPSVHWRPWYEVFLFPLPRAISHSNHPEKCWCDYVSQWIKVMWKSISLSVSLPHPPLSQRLTRPSKWVCTCRNNLMKRIKVMQQIKIVRGNVCMCVCTLRCLSEAPVCDLTAEYISHLDKKNSRFTVTGPQQHKPRAHINPQKPRHSFVKEQIAWIHSSFSCVLCQAVIAWSKVDCSSGKAFV